MQHPVGVGPYSGPTESLPFRRAMLLAALLAMLAFAGPRPAAGAVVADEPQYTLGILAHRGKEQALASWQPTVDYLERSLPGNRFRLLPLLLDEIEDAVAQRRVDFILANPENYVALEARHGVTRLATLQQAHKNQPLKEFGGLIFTRANRGDISKLSDLKGRRIAAPAKNAFGSYQMQAYELMAAGVKPDDFTPLFVGMPLARVFDAVAQGKADAGFAHAGMLEAMAAAGKIRLDDFRGIGLKRHPRYPYLTSTALYPEWPFSTLPHVDDDLASRVAVALLSLPHGGEVAARSGYHGWVVPLSYNSVHDLMKALRAPPYDTPENFSLADIARKYDRPIMVVLLGILAVLGYFMRRFARLNRVLGDQMTLVAERGDSLAAEVRTRELAERQLASENHVLELLAAETPLAQLLQSIVQMAASFHAGAGVAILLHDHGRYRLGAAHGIDPALRTRLDEMSQDAAASVANAGAIARRLADSGQNCLVEPIRDAAGELLGQVVLLTPAADADADHLGLFVTLAGMAIERTALGERMRLSASVFQNALEGIVITDAIGRIVDISPSFTHLTGFARDEAIGQTMNLLKSGRHDAEFYRDMWLQLLERGRWSGEIWNRTRDGRVIAEMLQISSVKDAQGQISHFVGTFSDITSLKDAQQHLEKLASFDGLTGLPNRVLLADRLEQALSQAQRRDRLLAICFLDLDGFKAVNDTLGHEAGDALLREVARRLAATVRTGDTVARMGGDEFVLLLGDIEDVDELETAVQRVLRSIAAPYELSGQLARISTSIGVTLFPLDDGDADSLLRHADQAMYRAKQDGRNRYHLFDTDYAAAHHERILQRDRLRLAVQQQELVLHYQPRVSLRERRIEGVEALLRWQHPDKGLMLPGHFLPDVERDDLICEIGTWVLREALAQQRRWREQGVKLAVSVNIAARQFLDPRFVPTLESLLAEFPGCGDDGFELEILESTAIEDTGRMIEVIEHGRRHGVRFALDDFGTGYSSLTHLQRLPADTLKIDRSFVNGMLASRSGLAIVETIVGLASAFQCDLVAEGIETLEQGELLARMGCGSGQGYVIARPMPADEVPPWIAAYHHPETWAFWANSAFGTQDFPLVLAEFEHRCWVNKLIGATEGLTLGMPSVVVEDPTRCEFGRWLDQRGRARYARSPLLAEVEELHREVHELGYRIQGDLEAGATAQARRHIPAMRQLSERLVGALGRLQRGDAGRSEAA